MYRKQFLSRRVVWVTGFWMLVTGSSGQPVSQRLQKAFQLFESDSQLKHAVSSLYVIDAATGQPVFEKNAQTGLAGASTQKIITAATAFELLGKEYTYKTVFIMGKDGAGGNYHLLVSGSGDPSFGSWRYATTKDSVIFKKVYESIQNTKPGTIWVKDQAFGNAAIPDGWIWEDIGNYYGAGQFQLNWKENQYEVFFESGLPNQPTKITRMGIDTSGFVIQNEVTAGKQGSGDNAYIYGTAFSNRLFLKGTIPPNQKSFSISGSVPDPPLEFAAGLKRYLVSQWGKKDPGTGPQIYVLRSFPSSKENPAFPVLESADTLYTYHSPSLDSIVYWFLKKSINLYGEALVKTLSREKQGTGSTDSGVAIVRKFWKEKGLDETELNIYDGSGLSPLNRLTTHAQVEVLKYARTRDWFPYFYEALPEFNGMKMKSGTISDVKGFCGYQRSKEGKEYIFSFLVNNYSGWSSTLVSKMYKVLDELK